MAANLRPGGAEPMTDINITPFVDIILVVLIAFMVTSTVVATEQIPVQFPEAATGEESGLTSLGISLTAAGTLYIDGKLGDRDALRRAIRIARERGDDVACAIGADGAVPHQEVMGIIDIVRQEGVNRFGIQVNPVPVPPEADRKLP